MQKKKTTNKKRERIISALLVLAILVTTAFAFLSATDSKTNVFTIGKVDIQLQENFDTDLSGQIDDDETFKDESQIQMENVIAPGQSVLKQPYVVNTGENEAWVYITVGVPTATSAEVFGNNQTESTIPGSTLSIDIAAYAIQDGYQGKNSAEEIWNKYFENRALFNNDAKDDDDRIELFEVNDLDLTKWTQLSDVYLSSDGYDYYVFAYNDKLAPASETVPVSKTSELFQSVTLIDAAGSPNNYTLSFLDGDVYKDTNSFSVRSTSPSSKFDSVTLDGAPVPSEDYTISGVGSTVVTFTNRAMLMSLTFDAHDIDVLATDGNADGVFTRKDINCTHIFDEEHICTLCGDKEPGFYDADDNLIVSWDESGIDATMDYDYLYDISRDDNGNETGRTPLGDHHYTNESTSGYNTINRYPETKTIVVPNTITRVGQAAFYGCANIDTIQLSDATTEIGLCAFNKVNAKTIYYGANVDNLTAMAFGSPNLTQINIDPDNDNYCDEDGIVFSKDKSTLIEYPSGKSETAYTIPSYIDTIGTYAFCQNQNLTNITVNDNVSKIETRAFSQCKALASISLPDTVTEIADYTFGDSQKLNTIHLGSSVKSIGNSAFVWCYSLKNVNVPDTVETIGNKAFSSCWALESITLPNSVVSIGTETFRNCKALTSITLSNNLGAIPNLAFYKCTSLASIDISDSVQSIGDYAFGGCTQLQNVKIGAGVKTIGKQAFYNDTVLSAVDFTNANSLKTIGTYAFYNCPKITSISTPDSLTTLSDYAFAKCTGLQTFKSGKGLTTISKRVFSGDDSLYTVYLPASLTTIGDYAFYNQGLSTVNYAGSETDKGNIQISTTGNTRLSTATWNYNVEY